MILGYARVSTKDQNLDGQRDALTTAGAEQIFADPITGTARARPELDWLLLELRSGDVVVVTYDFDGSMSITEHLSAMSPFKY